MKGTGHGLPLIDSKGDLAAATMLQSRLGREADVLQHLAQRCALAPGTRVVEIGEARTQLGPDSGDGPCPRSGTGTS